MKSREEILATLDRSGCLDGMAFMPEMLKYCGRRYRVAKRAHKTCDTVNMSGGRRLMASVHLEGLRCDGSAHGSCQAMCLLFWKNEWLKPVRTRMATDQGTGQGEQGLPEPTCTMADLERAVYRSRGAIPAECAYECQATRLPAATTPLPWWDFRQYVEDYQSGNVDVRLLMAGFLHASYVMVINSGIGVGRALVWVYDQFQKLTGGVPYPHRTGRVPPGQRTPTCSLALRPGDSVRVREFDQILDTLDRANKNRGMYFDAEEVPYCGKTFKVLRTVDRIIDEKSGRMLQFAQPSVILDGAYCQARYSGGRMFCPRAVFPLWRDAWLERAGQDVSTKNS